MQGSTMGQAFRQFGSRQALSLAFRGAKRLETEGAKCLVDVPEMDVE